MGSGVWLIKLIKSTSRATANAERKPHSLAGNFVEINMFRLKWCLLQQAPQSADDFAGAFVIPANVGKDFHELAEIGGWGFDNQFRRLGVGQNRAKWLVEFVRDRRGEFARHRITVDVSELRRALPCLHFYNRRRRRSNSRPKSTTAQIKVIGQRYCSHTVSSRKRTTLPAGSRPSLIFQRWSSRQSYCGVPWATRRYLEVTRRFAAQDANSSFCHPSSYFRTRQHRPANDA
jgi:hypothetical protein